MSRGGRRGRGQKLGGEWLACAREQPGVCGESRAGVLQGRPKPHGRARPQQAGQDDFSTPQVSAREAASESVTTVRQESSPHGPGSPAFEGTPPSGLTQLSIHIFPDSPPLSRFNLSCWMNPASLCLRGLPHMTLGQKLLPPAGSLSGLPSPRQADRAPH